VNEPARLAVLASGGGSNLQALIDHFHAGVSRVARVELVVGSRMGIGALERAAAARIAASVIDMAVLDPTEAAESMLGQLRDHRIDLVVLAGYLKLVPAPVVASYPDRIINIHPALLPAFGGSGMYGMRVHRAVLASGARVSGATVHSVTTRYDEGGILAQWPVPVLPDDTPEALAARVLRVEHLLLPLAVESVLSGEADGSVAAAEAFELTRAPVPPLDSILRLNRRHR
jgi:phosphoribosylglycinamide formyltransferase 1